MLELTGRKADGWLPTKMSPEQYGDSLDAIRTAAKEAGRDTDAFTPGLLGYVLLAPDDETLRRMCEHPLVRALCVMLPPHVYAELGVEPPLGQGGAFHAYLPSTIGRADALRRDRPHPARGGALLRVLRHGRAGGRGDPSPTAGPGCATSSAGTSPRSVTRRSPAGRSRRSINCSTRCGGRDGVARRAGPRSGARLLRGDQPRPLRRAARDLRRRHRVGDGRRRAPPRGRRRDRLLPACAGRPPGARGRARARC